MVPLHRGSDISIHSAARAETWRDPQYAGGYPISIHSAARAETPPALRRPMRGSISIHSAARAETLHSLREDWKRQISIHSAARAETIISRICQDYFVFQSTPPRGRRRCFSQLRGFCTDDFNPLRREGGDSDTLTLLRQLPEFQSTPPRGRRQQ